MDKQTESMYLANRIALYMEEQLVEGLPEHKPRLICPASHPANVTGRDLVHAGYVEIELLDSGKVEHSNTWRLRD